MCKEIDFDQNLHDTQIRWLFISTKFDILTKVTTLEVTTKVHKRFLDTDKQQKWQCVLLWFKIGLLLHTNSLTQFHFLQAYMSMIIKNSFFLKLQFDKLVDRLYMVCTQFTLYLIFHFLTFPAPLYLPLLIFPGAFRSFILSGFINSFISSSFTAIRMWMFCACNQL